MKLRFDGAVDRAVAILEEVLGASVPQTTVVRDALGAVTLVVPDAAVRREIQQQLSERLDHELGPFSPGPRRVLLEESELIDREEVLQSPVRVPLPEKPGIWIVDRLLTNQDWLRQPLWTEPPVPTMVGFSIKGGVGRTTALALLAWHLARKGRDVVVVDLDLEAPGIASILLPENQRPAAGVVDWCVESLVGQADAELLQSSLADAPLAETTEGRIRVMPALGSETRNYIIKLGRAYLPDVDPQGRVHGLADRVYELLSYLANSTTAPDAVLVDARAGLHDVGSAVVTQLGAEVLLFARNDPQTWRSYDCLFEHLRFARSARWGMPDEDLRWKLKMVAAQLEPTDADQNRFLDRSYETWAALYDEDRPGYSAVGKPMTFPREDESGPHYPLPIVFEPGIRKLDLVDPTNRPIWSYVEANFGRFLTGAEQRLFVDGAGEGEPS